MRDDARDVKRSLVDVWHVLRALGLEHGARRQPRGGAMVRCPAHGDRSPSCSVTVPDGTIRVKCFGCDLSGDVFTLIAAARGWDVKQDFPSVLEEAAEIAGIRLDLDPRDRPPVKPRPAPPVPAPDVEPLSADEFDRIASELYRRCALDAEDAGPVRDYLASRKLLHQAEATLCGALPPVERQGYLIAALAEMFGRDVVVRSGFVSIRDDGTPRLDRFSWCHHRLLIPWFGPGAEAMVTTVQRRRLEKGEPKYVFPPERRPEHLYGIEQAENGDPTAPVVFVEGALDTLAARTLYAHAGLDVLVLGIPGLSNWRPEWALVAEGREARIAVDSDDAANKAIDTIARDLAKAGATRIGRSQHTGLRRKDWGDEVAAR